MRAPAVTIRAATAADVEPLHTLILAVAGHHDQTAHVHATAATLTRDGFGPTPRFAALVADTGGGLVGFVSYTWNYSVWLAGEYMNIDDVFVATAHRGRGVGTALMVAAGQVCRDRGCGRVRWEVEPDNAAAIRFYERLGARPRTKGVFGWDV